MSILDILFPISRSPGWCCYYVMELVRQVCEPFSFLACIPLGCATSVLLVFCRVALPLDLPGPCRDKGGEHVASRLYATLSLDH